LWQFLDTFTKLQKATIRIIMSVRPYAHEIAWLLLDGL